MFFFYPRLVSMLQEPPLICQPIQPLADDSDRNFYAPPYCHHSEQEKFIGHSYLSWVSCHFETFIYTEVSARSSAI